MRHWLNSGFTLFRRCDGVLEGYCRYIWVERGGPACGGKY